MKNRMSRLFWSASWIIFGAHFSYGEVLEKDIYINKSLYKLHSTHQAQIDLKSKEFNKKYPNKLGEYQSILERLNQYSQIPEDKLTNDQKKEVKGLTDNKSKIEALIGTEYEKTIREINDLNQQSEMLYAQTVKSVFGKIVSGKEKADGIKIWAPHWYYLTPKIDITDLVIDEVNNRPWNRKFIPEPVKITKIYYVEQKRVMGKFTSSTMNTNEFLDLFYQACAQVGKNTGAELIIEHSQSGYELVRDDLDLTDTVSTEMLKLSARR